MEEAMASQTAASKASSTSGPRVAVLATNGFEQVELTEPVKALRQAGASVTIVAPERGQIQGMHHDKPGDKIAVDKSLDEVKPEEFDALVLPGGVANPDTLRINAKAVAFVGHFVRSKRPIGAICHGPWTLIEAGGVKGHKLTSWPSLKTDLTNAGATWIDQDVVVDEFLVTSRNPKDLPAFDREIVKLFAARAPHHQAAS
jgi:deglycase